ncbi:MAG: hypothetical protein HDT14_05305 [Oscillibacter sp.]|nr:hypothetical protein [Oscillibacter sp.]
MSDLNTGEKAQRVSRVTLVVDGETMYTAGDDSGRTIQKNCLWGTQAMADSILASLRDVEYQPFSGTDGLLDPAAELGDGVTVGGVYSTLAKADITFDGLYSADIAAPGEDEGDEDNYRPRVQRQSDRELAKIRSSITKTADRITLLVENELAGLSGKLELTASSLTAEINNTRDGLNSKIEQTASSLTTKITDTEKGLNSKIEQTASSLTTKITDTQNGLNSKIEQTASSLTTKINATDGRVSTLSQTVSGISTRVSNAEGDISALEQFADSLTLSVSNGSTSSRISISAGGVTLASQTINMTGLVTYTGLESGTTVINGGCIQTGMIDAAYINLTGAITFSDLSRNLRDDINDAYAMAEDAQSVAYDLDGTVGGWMYRGTTYIDGSKIMAGTVMASQLLGGTVLLLDEYERIVGGLEITRTQTGNGVELYTDYGGIRISAAGNFWVDADYGSFGIIDTGIACGNHFVPMRSVYYDLGGPGLEWKDIYADNDAIITSDRSKKQDISYDLSVYDRFFDALRPASYRLKNGTSGRTHLGLIAQDVEEALEACGLTSTDFAGLVKAPREDGGYDYALRYGELISMLIMKYQTLNARVAELERRIVS